MLIFVKTLSGKTIHLGGRGLGYYRQCQGQMIQEKKEMVLAVRDFDKRMGFNS